MKIKLITLAILIAAGTLQAAPRNITVRDYFEIKEKHAFLMWSMDTTNALKFAIYTAQLNYLVIFGDVLNKPVERDYLDRTNQIDRANNPTAPSR